jgi:hypothetical protein
MWIFTQTGFVSVVRNESDDGLMHVRARDAESLKELATLSGEAVAKTPNGDYPYRIDIPEMVLVSWLTASVGAIDYLTNFKGRVGQVRGWNFAEPLHTVWDAMRMAEDGEARQP